MIEPTTTLSRPVRGLRWTPSGTVSVRPQYKTARRGGEPRVNGYVIHNALTNTSDHVGQGMAREAARRAARFERDNLRTLQDGYATEYGDVLCETGTCDHQHDQALADIITAVKALPIVSRDYSTPGCPYVAVFVSFTRRSLGGWYVTRTDNGRVLGWIVKTAGRWHSMISASAFRGDGLDQSGDLMDRVPGHLHHSPDGTERSGTHEVDTTREEAARSIVTWLVREHAPAVGYPTHPLVRLYRTSPAQHFPLGDHDERCVCGQAWPCPTRDAMTAGGGK